MIRSFSVALHPIGLGISIRFGLGAGLSTSLSAGLMATAALLPRPLLAATPLAQVNGQNPSASICQTSFRVVRTEASNGKLNLRRAPRTDAPMITQINNGTEVMFNLGDRSGKWAEITTPTGQTGWASEQFLIPINPGTSQFRGTLKVRTLDGGPVNLRQSPSLNGKAIASLPSGTIVTRKGNAGYWTEVVTPANQRGYIASQFLICN